MNPTAQKNLNKVGLTHKSVIRSLPDFKAEKTQQYTTLGLTLVVLIVFGIFAISPTLSTIAQLRKKISDDNVVLNQLQTKNQNLNSLTTQYSDLQSDLPVLYASIPQTPDSSKFVGQLQRLGQNDNVAITSVEVNNVAVAPLVQTINTTTKISFTLNASGSKDQLDSFVKSLETLSRLITIDSLTYTGSTDN